MPVFALDQLRALAASYATLQERLDAIATAYASCPYKTLPGKQYATHGFLRRFNTMHHPSAADSSEQLMTVELTDRI
jgi:hypothetical protein